MRYLLSIVLLMFSCVMSTAQEKRALLIGIGDYPEELGWNKIHGQNDVAIIKQTLNEQGFSNNNVIECINSDATYDKILRAFQILIEESQKNDIIYIHFSGHGQRITDMDGDESDNLDEAWIPYDAHKSYSEGIYEGERHITDDYLNEYLTNLRRKIGPGGKIIVIADACHSGSGSRGQDNQDIIKRGTNDTFIIPKEQINVVRKDRSVDWLFVAACKAYQTNYEYRDDEGKYYGSLSYCISKSKENLSEIKYSDAIDIWGGAMQEITVYPQDIDCEGKPSKHNSYLF